MRKILELCLKNGAELASPGEFTKRAFLNGRMDLSQAESVIDIINAKSEREAKEGMKHLEGALRLEMSNIKRVLLELMTNIEVSIDYPEYDTPEVENSDISEKINQLREKLKELEDSFQNGKILKDGVKTVIVGKPNAGKSSLLNAILKEERAIVTEIEGTTRDTIEEFVTINGIPIKLVDTAGIRNTENLVEKIGIEKSKNIAENADLIIAILDCSRELEEEDFEILKIAKNKKSIIILNKIDLSAKFDENDEVLKDFTGNIIKISALQKIGLEELYQKISDLFNFNEINFDGSVLITNQRHKNLISKAIQSLEKANQDLNNNMPVDIIEISLYDVLSDLGAISGEKAGEEVIDEIFSRFCLGK